MAEDYIKLKADYDSLKRLHDTTNNNVVSLMKTLDQQRIQIDLLEAKNKQHISSRVVMDDIIQKRLNEVNFLNNKYLEEIESLKADIKKLKNGGNN